MAFTSYEDGSLKPKEVIFVQHGNQPRVSLVGTFTDSVIVRIGEAQSLVSAQELLNAARFMGAKDIDARIK